MAIKISGTTVIDDGKNIENIDTADVNTLSINGTAITASATEINYVDGLNQYLSTSDSPTFNSATLSGTGALRIPAGNTSQRPAGANGLIRLNTSTPALEAYYDNNWQNIVGNTVLIQDVNVAFDVGTVNLTAFDNSRFVDYFLCLGNVLPRSQGARLQMRTSSDGGSTFDSGSSDYDYIVDTRDVNGNILLNTAEDFNRIVLSPDLDDDAGEGVSGTLHMNSYVLFEHNMISGILGARNKFNRYTMSTCFGVRVAGPQTNALQFFWSSGNFDRGKFRLYGRKIK